MQPLSITAYTLTTACGVGNEENLDALRSRTGGLIRNDMKAPRIDCWVGRVNGLEEPSLPESLQSFECRNNRLALFCLNQDGFESKARSLINKHGPHRVGLFIGTSTSGVEETEKAYAKISNKTNLLPDDFNYYHTQNVFSAGNFLYRHLGLSGPAQVVSTACSSSAKAFAAASRHIAAGFCDAAIVGGVDTLCELTLYGFNSLQLVSAEPCRPFDATRNGISIGEAAGFVLLEKENGNSNPYFMGYGESSDAYHISSPHPEGKGAANAMQDALRRASLSADSVDYLNLHGTATPANDSSESKAVLTALGDKVPCSSTKGWTGHTLGAAGIADAIICLLSLQNDFYPGMLNTKVIDPTIEINCQIQNKTRQLNTVMTNSFGFGGSNCSLLFGNKR